MLAAVLGFTHPTLAAQTSPPADPRPLSPAQIALFETPHLQNIGHSETLDYQMVRDGPQGFTDTVAVHIRQLYPDGTRDVSFDFLTGPRRMAFPGLAHFRGNPLLMLVLERDVREMKATIGLSAAYFRDRIRQAFVDRATVADGSFVFEGRPIPARVVTVLPFANDARLEHLPTVQRKSYVFVLADGVPGMIAEVRIASPADAAAKVPAVAERLTFQGVAP